MTYANATTNPDADPRTAVPEVVLVQAAQQIQQARSAATTENDPERAGMLALLGIANCAFFMATMMQKIVAELTTRKDTP